MPFGTATRPREITAQSDSARLPGSAEPEALADQLPLHRLAIRSTKPGPLDPGVTPNRTPDRPGNPMHTVSVIICVPRSRVWRASPGNPSDGARVRSRCRRFVVSTHGPRSDRLARPRDSSAHTPRAFARRSAAGSSHPCSRLVPCGCTMAAACRPQPLASLHRDRGQGHYASTVHDERKLLTAPELDEMSPDERAAAVNDRVVTDLDELPPEFRDQVVATGRRLAVERTQTEE